MPPRVLPSVATASAGHTAAAPLARTPARTSSEPPGSSVAARKLLRNRVPRPIDSFNWTAGSGHSAATRGTIDCSIAVSSNNTHEAPLSAAPVPPQQLDLRKCFYPVVLVRAFADGLRIIECLGTAFFFRPGLLMTCWHCVKEQPPAGDFYAVRDSSENGNFRVHPLLNIEQDKEGRDIATAHCQ